MKKKQKTKADNQTEKLQDQPIDKKNENYKEKMNEKYLQKGPKGKK